MMLPLPTLLLYPSALVYLWYSGPSKGVVRVRVRVTVRVRVKL